MIMQLYGVAAGVALRMKIASLHISDITGGREIVIYRQSCHIRYAGQQQGPAGDRCRLRCARGGRYVSVIAYAQANGALILLRRRDMKRHRAAADERVKSAALLPRFVLLLPQAACEVMQWI